MFLVVVVSSLAAWFVIYLCSIKLSALLVQVQVVSDPGLFSIVAAQRRPQTAPPPPPYRPTPSLLEPLAAAQSVLLVIQIFRGTGTGLTVRELCAGTINNDYKPTTST